MAVDESQITEPTWAGIAKGAKAGMLALAVGGKSYTLNGRQFTRADMDELKAMYEFAIQMINDESSDAANGIALVTYGEPR